MAGGHLRLLAAERAAQDDARGGLGFGGALDMAPNACIRIDERMLIQQANPAACEVLGIPHGRRGVLAGYIASADMAPFFRFVRDLYCSLDMQRTTLRMRHHRGGEFWVQLQGRQLTGADAPGALLSITEVNAPSHPSAPAQSHPWLRELFEAMPDAVFLVSDGRVQRANPAAARLTGGDPVGRWFAELIVDRNAEPADAAGHREVVFRGERGTSQATDVTWHEVRIDDGPAVLCVARDLARGRDANAERAERERMKAVCVLAEGVAHELNNPLTVITMNLKQLAESIDAAPLALAAKDALEGAERMTSVIDDLQGFARDGDERDEVDVNTIVERALTRLRPHCAATVHVTSELGRVLPIVAGESQLTQIVYNLLVNAVQALPRGEGNVSVSTSVDDEGVRITVRDNGVGIAPGVHRRLFEPFVTTRDVGKGKGLGLYVAQRYAEALGGRIICASDPGRGACFSLVLPPAPGRQTTETAVVRMPRMLVVDDEASIRRLLAATLSRVGEVVTVGDAAAACDLLATGVEFDAVLCDLLMPGGGGSDVHAWIAQERPELLPRLGFMTGGATTSKAREFLERVGPSYLAKPFNRAQLLDFLQTRMPTDDD